MKNILKVLDEALENGVVSERQVQGFLDSFSKDERIVQPCKIVSVGGCIFNLEDSFNDENIRVDSIFSKILEEAFFYSKSQFSFDATYQWYENVQTAHDETVSELIGDGVIDLDTNEGRLEARRRLGYMRMEIENQSKEFDSKRNEATKRDKCNEGVLLTDGRPNILGRFRLMSGEVVSIAVFCCGVTNQWAVYGWPKWEWRDRTQFLSETITQ